MKKITIIILALSMMSCGSYTVTTSRYDAPAKIIQTIELDYDHDTAYIMANEWMVENFGNAKSVIQFSDKEGGIIKGKYLMFPSTTLYTGMYSTIPHTLEDRYAIITIRIKEGAARIEVDPLGEIVVSHYNHKTYGLTPEYFVEMGDNLIKKFENYMKYKTTDF